MFGLIIIRYANTMKDRESSFYIVGYNAEQRSNPLGPEDVPSDRPKALAAKIKAKVLFLLSLSFSLFLCVFLFVFSFYYGFAFSRFAGLFRDWSQ